MKKLLLLTFIIVAVFISCKHPSEEEYYPILPDYSSGFDMVFDNIPDLGLSTILSVMGWVSEEIDYVPDYVYHNVDEYWQSPGETYDMQTGDCEDYSILAMYLIYRRDIEPKIIPEMVVGYMYKGSGLHAWVRVDGRLGTTKWK